MPTQTLNQSQNPLEMPELQPVLKILRLAVFDRDPASQIVTLADLRMALRFLDIRKDVRRSLASKLGKLSTPATANESEALMTLDNRQQGKLKFDRETSVLLQEMLLVHGCFLSVPETAAKPRTRMKLLYQGLLDAARRVPGQESASVDAALQLAMQISEKERQTAASLLLHGPHGCGTTEMALELATSLQESGYALLEIDCSQFRADGEASSFDGSKSYWAGSKPGIVTSFIHRYPKAVVVFHGIDRTLPRVMETLRGALSTGIMVDSYGLEDNEIGQGRAERKDERPPTPVDCRNAIFLFTASTGSEWYQNPDFANVLGDQATTLATFREAFWNATQEHRGEKIPVFDAPVLKSIDQHMALLRPQNWALLQQAATKNLPKSVAAFQARFDCAVEVVDDAQALIQAHLLAAGVSQGLAATSPAAMEQSCLAKLGNWLIMEKHPAKRARLICSASARHTIEKLLEKLGDEPLEALRRKRQHLHFEQKIEVGAKGVVEVTISRVEVKKAYALSDFNGDVVHLVAKVPDIQFENVAGHDEIKQFFREMIAYLRQPERVSALGIDLPRGVVLHGPPGTGKTMLAQAFAGQAELPFISVAAPDLLHPERIRELYRIAHANAPAVIFVDEADSLGRRGANSSAHDAALNKLLTKIQGFSSSAPIFHILATNRPELLDEALTRSGRIDRSYYIGPLERAARGQLLDKLMVLTQLDSDHKENLLSQTHGLTGSEMAQVQRECGLRLLREQEHRPIHGQYSLSLDAVLDEINIIKYGQRSKRQRLSVFRERVAIHEIGHALAHHFLFPEIPIDLVTITPRQGGNQGFLALKTEDMAEFDETPSRIQHHITVLLAGRAAEMLAYGNEGKSTGASNDLARASKAAWQAIAMAGLDDIFGPLSLAGFQRAADIPPALAEKAWARVNDWLRKAEEHATALLQQHWPLVRALSSALDDQEYLDGDMFNQIIRDFPVNKCGDSATTLYFGTAQL